MDLVVFHQQCVHQAPSTVFFMMMMMVVVVVVAISTTLATDICTDLLFTF